ncbi:MAG: polysaccharide deacetylase family protein [Bacteroidota bacterium]
MHTTIIVYTPKASPRLQYILDWLFKEQLKVSYTLTHHETEVIQLPFFVSYGAAFHNALSIPDMGLLWEQSIAVHDIQIGNWKGLPTLYAGNKNAYMVPFDLLSAIFFLLSRYEEHYSYTPDKHGRYPATESILYKEGWLQEPIVDQWVQSFREMLINKYQIPINTPLFSFQPTYDIDIAFSYLHKGLKRTVGGYLRDIVAGRWGKISERKSVLSKKQPDPYDSFQYLQQLHAETGYQPIYFILAASSTSEFDKNISPTHPAMQTLVRQMGNEGKLGIHPSYFTAREKGLFLKEKTVLERIAGKEITQSRQHFIKFVIPKTPIKLIKKGIKDDYSLGYGSHLGFRAGTGQSFRWYDIGYETISPIRIHPFCFMDTTAKYEMGLSVIDAFTQLDLMKRSLQRANSQLVTIFHNFSLGTDPEWKGWAEAYTDFVKGIPIS